MRLHGTHPGVKMTAHEVGLLLVYMVIFLLMVLVLLVDRMGP